MTLVTADEPARSTIPDLTFTVAITGHRDLAQRDTVQVQAAIETVLTRVRAVLAAHSHRPLDGMKGLTLRFLSGLAPGADLLGVEAAFAANEGLPGPVPHWQPQAILPFAARRFAETFGQEQAAERDRMLQLAASIPCLELADWAWTQPIEPTDPPSLEWRREARWRERRYTLVGQMLVRRADLLIAVWRGGPAKGRGGTAEVVAEAWRSGVPVVWIHPETHQVRSILPDLGKSFPDIVDDPVRVARNGADEATALAARHVLLSVLERDYQTRWADEHEPGRNDQHFAPANAYVTGEAVSEWQRNAAATPEPGTHAVLYQWLLWLIQPKSAPMKWPFVRMKPVPVWAWNAVAIWRWCTRWHRRWVLPLQSWSDARQNHVAPWPGMVADDVARMKAQQALVEHATTSDAPLLPFFERADRIATRLSHHYRSGYIAIFALASIAVVLAGAWLAEPELKPVWVLLEVGSIIAVLWLFARLSDRSFRVLPFLRINGNNTHQRFIDARFLAESLRGAVPLSWIGFAGRRPIAPTEPPPDPAFAREQAQDKAHNKRKPLLWTPPFANAIIATSPLPRARMDRERIGVLCLGLLAVITDQQDYHERNHLRLRRLHAVLDGVGFVLVLVAALVSLVYLGVVCIAAFSDGHGLIGEVANEESLWHEWIEHTGHAAAFCGSVFPGMAAALAGIRYHGDFERFSERSSETQQGLHKLAERGRALWHRAAPEAALTGQAPLFEELFTLMLDTQDLLDEDLQDWRFAYKARPVPLP